MSSLIFLSASTGATATENLLESTQQSADTERIIGIGASATPDQETAIALAHTLATMAVIGTLGIVDAGVAHVDLGQTLTTDRHALDAAVGFARGEGVIPLDEVGLAVASTTGADHVGSTLALFRFSAGITPVGHG